MKKSIIILFIISLLIGCVSFNIYAADQKDNIKVLVLTKKKNGKTKHIKAGKRVVLWTKSETKVKGILENLTDNTIIVNGNEYPLSSIEAIRISHIGAKITGGIIGGTGLGGTVGAAFMYFAGLSEGGCGGAFAMIFGIVLGTISAIVLSIGLIIFFIGKKYKSKKWKFSTAQVSE